MLHDQHIELLLVTSGLDINTNCAVIYDLYLDVWLMWYVIYILFLTDRGGGGGL